MTQTPAGELALLGALAPTWAGQTAWRLLATRFELGLHFLKTWQAWRDNPQRPQRLHYVGLSHAPPDINAVLACAGPCPQLLALARELAAQWFELQPGFHRFTLDRGGVMLTLCVGELISLLREQSFSADHVFLDASSPGVGATPPWNRWSAKALARCCRRGTGLTATGDVALVRADLMQCGFEFQATPNEDPEGPESGLLHGQFNPRWTLRA
ncbi:MAG: FAD-dependent cmnm(5)s(2)U34 oxidoreductase, partial [Candidatus Saccharibacteria bacterium]|nr:FAD-dependent cmnm(5)s(2)U34 oxidoreductase [Rhodoferax sp.]